MPQNFAEQAWTPSQNEAIQTQSSQSASAGTVSAETPLLESSLGQRTTMDFAGRWLNLPNSVDLDARKSATPSNNYANVHTSSDSNKQIVSSWFVAADTHGGLRQSADTANFGLIFLACALGALIFGRALRLARQLHTWPAPKPKEWAHEHTIGLGELTRALRRVDESVDSARFSDRTSATSHRSLRIEERQNERAFDFAVRPDRHSVADLVVTLP
jgi:hypothetical protein